MKSYLLIISLMLLQLACSNANSTSSDEHSDGATDKPTIKTKEVTKITTNSAYCGGFDIDDGDGQISEKGICWSQSTQPNIYGNHIKKGNGTENFSVKIKDLVEGAKYYVRAYAKNSLGVSYGEVHSFKVKIGSLDIPCEPKKNTFSFSFQDTFYSTYTHSDDDSYEIRANGSENSYTLRFSEIPETGIYKTTRDIFPNEGECEFSGVSGSQYCVVPKGGLIYVVKNGEDKYSVTFCDLRFISSLIDFEASGNITTD